MKEELELIRQIRALKSGQKELQSEREIIFLAGLRKKLELHISQNPIKTGKVENFWRNLKKSDVFTIFKNIGSLGNAFSTRAGLAIIFLALLGTGGITFASQASLPGDNLYPVKILGEEIRSGLASSPAKQARLEAEFSVKRIEEIKKVIQKNGTGSKNIDIALSRLQRNTAKAAEIIEKEKRSGKDVSELARDINGKMESNQEAIREIFKNGIEKIKDESKNLNEKIKEAEASGNSPLADSLAGELDKTEAAQKKLETNRAKNDELLEKEANNIRNSMKESERKTSQKSAAQKEISEAEKGKQYLLKEITKEKISLPASAFSGFDGFLAEARGAFLKEDFLGAQNLAKNALSNLNEIEKNIDGTANKQKIQNKKIDKNGDTEDDEDIETEDDSDPDKYTSSRYIEDREAENK